MVKKECSPDVKQQGSCISRKTMERIAEILNKRPQCKRINKNCKTETLSQKIQSEVKKLSDCDKESCWFRVKEIKEHLKPHEWNELVSNFRPEKPEKWKYDKNTWLNTTNIDEVMRQYERAYPDFQYLGALPIDFGEKTPSGTCSVSSVCNLSLQTMINNGKKSFGIVFNVDPHNKPGQHWYSMFVDLVGKNQKRKPFIYYFDSIKSQIQDEVYTFIQNIQSEFQELYPKKTLGFTYNDLQHQFGDTECGIYCIHFLTEMLKGVSFREYVDRQLSDKQMEEFRDVFFIEK